MSGRNACAYMIFYVFYMCVCACVRHLECVRQDVGHLQWLAGVCMAEDGEILVADRLELNTDAQP